MASKSRHQEGDDGDSRSDDGDGVEVTFMTRNLYLDADTNPIGFATIPVEAIMASIEALAVLEATNFLGPLLPRCLKPRGDEWFQTPSLVVSLGSKKWYSTRFIDAASQNDISREDFLPILMEALNSQGSAYSVASEYVAGTSGPIPTDFTLATVVFQTLRNVMLVKDNPDTVVLNEAQGVFVEQFVVETVVPDRGYQYIDVLMGDILRSALRILILNVKHLQLASMWIKEILQ